MSDKPRILVVDDRAGVRESLRFILQPQYEVATAESGEAALEVLPAFQPDLVFLDIKMPTLDGLEVLRRIKAHDPTIEVVMMTAYASLETLRQALTDGAFEYLIKPFFRRDVEETARRALARRKKGRPSMARPRGGVTLPEDRRRYPRVEVSWTITLENGARSEWQGEMVVLSPFGAKVRLGMAEPGPPEGSIVRLQFAPPDGESPIPMSVKTIVWRADRDGLILVFLDLSPPEFHRIKSLVDGRLKQPA